MVLKTGLQSFTLSVQLVSLSDPYSISNFVPLRFEKIEKTFIVICTSEVTNVPHIFTAIKPLTPTSTPGVTTQPQLYCINQIVILSWNGPCLGIGISTIALAIKESG